MLEKLILRKSASEEGINPYGVGALGAGGLTLGAKHGLKLYDKSLEDRVNLLYKKKNELFKKHSTDTAKAKELIQAYKDAANLVLDSHGANNGLILPSTLSKIDASIKNHTDKVLFKRDSSMRAIKKIHNLVDKLNKRKQLVKTLGKNGLIGSGAITGLLGYKYLYDKLTDWLSP